MAGPESQQYIDNKIDHKEEKQLEQKLDGRNFTLSDDHINAIITKYAWIDGWSDQQDDDQVDLYINWEIKWMNKQAFDTFMEPFVIIKDTLGVDFVDTVLLEKNAVYEDLQRLSAELKPLYEETKSSLLLSKKEEIDLANELNTRSTERNTTTFSGETPDFIDTIDEDIATKITKVPARFGIKTNNPTAWKVLDTFHSQFDWLQPHKGIVDRLKSSGLSDEVQDKFTYATIANISNWSAMVWFDTIWEIMTDSEGLTMNDFPDYLKKIKKSADEMKGFESNLIQWVGEFMEKHPEVETTEWFRELMNPSSYKELYDNKEITTVDHITKYFETEYASDIPSLNNPIEWLEGLQEKSGKALVDQLKSFIWKISESDAEKQWVWSLVDKWVDIIGAVGDKITTISDTYPEIRVIIQYAMDFFNGDLDFEDMKWLESKIEKARNWKVNPEERAAYKHLTAVTPSKESVYKDKSDFMLALLKPSNRSTLDPAMKAKFDGDWSSQDRIMGNMNAFVTKKSDLDGNIIKDDNAKEYWKHYDNVRKSILAPLAELQNSQVTDTQKNEIVLMSLLTWRYWVRDKMIADLDLKHKNALDEATANKRATDAKAGIKYVHKWQVFSITKDGKEEKKTYESLDGTSLRQKRNSFKAWVKDLLKPKETVATVDEKFDQTTATEWIGEQEEKKIQYNPITQEFSWYRRKAGSEFSLDDKEWTSLVDMKAAFDQWSFMLDTTAEKISWDPVEEAQMPFKDKDLDLVYINSLASDSETGILGMNEDHEENKKGNQELWLTYYYKWEDWNIVKYEVNIIECMDSGQVIEWHPGFEQWVVSQHLEYTPDKNWITQIRMKEEFMQETSSDPVT